jgi:NADPH:quinone reductase
MVQVVTPSIKSLQVNNYGTPDHLVIATEDSQSLGEQDVRIAVHACGVNFADVMAIAGNHQNTPSTPFTPGFEVAGEIIEIGVAVKSLKVGDRVMAAFSHGGYAAETVTSELHAVRIPDNLDFSTAAAMPIAFGTAYFALIRRAKLQPGEWLLVQGGSGNIGGGALQIGKLLGATVIATGRGQEGCDLVQQLGADYAIDHTTENLVERVQQITRGHGADVIFDPVTGSTFKETINCVAYEGRHIIAGGASGVPNISLMEPLIHNCSLVGGDFDYYLYQDIAAVNRAFKTIMSWYERDFVKARTPKTFPFEQAAEVLDQVASGQLKGKAVLLPR